MIKFSEDKVLLLQQLIIKSTGGSFGVRDEKLLNSAIQGIYQTYDGSELYPTKEEKGAQLCFSLISNHAFVDGNKRIGILMMLSFLEINGIHLEYCDADLVDLGMKIANGNFKTIDILKWINTHKK